MTSDQLKRVGDLAGQCMMLAADCYRNQSLRRDDVAIECARRLNRRAAELLQELTKEVDHG